LLAALDARDRYTAGHSAAVAVYARDIARGLGLSEADQHLAHVGGLVHDIGMISLPSSLLKKPGPLTPEERGRMQEHPVIGERILASVEDCAEVARIESAKHGGAPVGPLVVVSNEAILAGATEEYRTATL
jgi:HD-GYP domain-containing protein (c-di-GMP phosphodiesterase class II)